MKYEDGSFAQDLTNSLESSLPLGMVAAQVIAQVLTVVAVVITVTVLSKYFGDGVMAAFEEGGIGINIRARPPTGI